MGKGQGQRAGGQAWVSTNSGPPFQPLTSSGALCSCLGHQVQLPGQDHTLRVVKTPGPGVALGNELTKSLSYEEPGSGGANMAGLHGSSGAEPGTEMLA